MGVKRLSGAQGPSCWCCLELAGVAHLLGITLLLPEQLAEDSVSWAVWPLMHLTGHPRILVCESS